MNFDKAFERVIGHEGGYVNDPRDAGGETKYGISKRAYPSLDIKNLTLEQAKEVYLNDYWNKCHIEELPNCVRFDMFDMAVNAGVAGATRCMQRALGVNVDGMWGKNTSAAVASITDPQQLDKRFAGYRLIYISDLPSFPTYGRGWVKRIASNLIED